MPRAAQVRRAPNREPASLAAAVTILDVVEAIDTVDPVAAVDPHIDLALTNDDAYSTPTPPISKEYPLPNDANDGYIYPLPPIPPSPLIPSHEISWSPTPPPLLLLLAETVVLDNDLHPQPHFK